MPPSDNSTGQAPIPPQQNFVPVAPTPVPTPIKIGKFKASNMIVKESWAILKQDKEIMWFPILSSIVSLIAFVIMGGFFFFLALHGSSSNFETTDANGNMHVLNAAGYVILFVYYFVMMFIANYFLAAIYTIVHGRFNGQNLSFQDGMNGASKNFGKILGWSAISATVGVILRIIGNMKAVGKIVSLLLGAAWNILTYFSLPSLIIGETSIIGSFKDSAAIIRKTWGEAVIISFGVGIFFSILIFLGLALDIGLIILIPVARLDLIIIFLYGLFVVGIIIISSSLSAIFKLALYEYAKTGKVPQGFTPALIQNAVKAK